MKTIGCNLSIMNKIYDVIVIDSGVNDKEIDAIYIQKKNGKYTINDEVEDHLDHGTNVVKLINKNYKKKILMIKIIDNKDEIISENQLIYILNYIYKFLKCKIINISLGVSVVTSNRLYNICKKIRKRNIFINCAFNNDKSISYPAFFDCVFGVDCDFNLKKTDDYIFLKNNPFINILAYGSIQRVNKKEKIFESVWGTSFACANFTRILYDIIIKKQFNVYKELEINAKYLFKFKESTIIHTPFNLEYIKSKKVAIFPFSKENQNILRLVNDIPINIVDFYDFKESGRVNSNLNYIYKLNGKDYIVKNIEKLEIESFDTLLIGHINRYNSKIQENIYSIIKMCIKKNKKIISYDDLKFENNLYFTPKFKKIESLSLLMGKLFKFNTPILLSCGTGSKEGKFTFQVKLKSYLEDRQYNIAFIGSEPNSFLFGAKDCIHCGYNSNLIEFTHRELISNINYRLHLIDEKNFDMIIIGSQANILSRNYNSVENIQLENFSYFAAINPDVITLNIHCEDDINYIKKSISFMTSLNDCHIAGIIVFPLKNVNNKNSLITEEERQKILNELKINFPNIPVAFLDDNIALKEIFDNIISFFI